MTSILKDDDKIFTMYKQYKELIHKDAEENNNHVYGTDQLAAQLTVAHLLDHMVCLFKKDKLPTVGKEWGKVRMSPLMKTTEEVELEIMQNNAEATSSSANVKIDWGRTN